MQNPEFIYKVATIDSVEEAKAAGSFSGMPIDARDGYIHFSTAEQLRETLSLHFRGVEDLMLLAVRSAVVEDKLRWESSRGGLLFPHLYGSFPMSSVAWMAPIQVEEDGTAELPKAVR